MQFYQIGLACTVGFVLSTERLLHPELGHTPAVLWGRPFVFGMNSPEHHPDRPVDSWPPATRCTKGFRSPGLNAITRCFLWEVVGPEGLEPSTKGYSFCTLYLSFIRTASTSQGAPCKTALAVEPSSLCMPSRPWLPITMRFVSSSDTAGPENRFAMAA